MENCLPQITPKSLYAYDTPGMTLFTKPGFLQFYLCMFLAYVAIGCAWGLYCYRNIHDLLPIQYYLSSLVGFLIIEMVASWGKVNCYVQQII